MRSKEIWTLASNSCIKVKRKKVNWYHAIQVIDDKELRGSVWQAYYALMARHPEMSANRRAYNALKRHFSTTALSYYRFKGEWLVL